jgi:septal ring factor EnvC (AmiA/AmiB activator)
MCTSIYMCICVCVCVCVCVCLSICLFVCLSVSVCILMVHELATRIVQSTSSYHPQHYGEEIQEREQRIKTLETNLNELDQQHHALQLKEQSSQSELQLLQRRLEEMEHVLTDARGHVTELETASQAANQRYAAQLANCRRAGHAALQNLLDRTWGVVVVQVMRLNLVCV